MTKETESWENKVERWKTPFYKKALMRTGAFLRAALRETRLFFYPKAFRFFYPKVIPGDIVSQIFVSAFRWSFFTVAFCSSVDALP